MRRFMVKRPIGLNAVCDAIEDICSKAGRYKHGLKPEHFIIPLDAGEGRTTLLEYMAGKYREAGVLSFESSTDDYIEVCFDGTVDQLEENFRYIDSAADYANEFGNIVGMDISALASHLKEKQVTDFIKNCRIVCNSACVVFFVHRNPSKNEEQLIKEIEREIRNVRRLNVETYTHEEICQLVIRILDEYGIEVREMEKVSGILLGQVINDDSNTVKAAIDLADRLTELADYTSFTPFIDMACMREMKLDDRNNMKGSV